MSCNVLVIPEDFRLDQYILQPLVKAMMRKIGRPSANVRVLTNPLLGGLEQAVKLEMLMSIVDQYPLVDLFLLLVDRDGKKERRQVLDARERAVGTIISPGRAFFAQEAWQEIEVWGLASQQLPEEWRWSDIRNDPHPKERYYDVFADKRGIANTLTGGRRQIGRDVSGQYAKIRSRCPEVQTLESRIGAWLQG